MMIDDDGDPFPMLEDSINNPALEKYSATYDTGIEMAFEIRKADQLLGWLVFQMDMAFLGQKYEIEEKDLMKFTFDRP